MDDTDDAREGASATDSDFLTSLAEGGDSLIAVDVCRRLMSQNRREYESVLQECFSPTCVIDNDDIWLYGRDRIQQALDFTTSICSASGMVGVPIWNPHKLNVTFTYFRQLKLGPRVTQITTLHLKPVLNGSTTRYWVEKIGDRHVNMPWTAWPVLGHIHLYLIRPLFSWMIVLVASLLDSRPAEPRRPGRRSS